MDAFRSLKQYQLLEQRVDGEGGSGQGGEGGKELGRTGKTIWCERERENSDRN